MEVSTKITEEKTYRIDSREGAYFGIMVVIEGMLDSIRIYHKDIICEPKITVFSGYLDLWLKDLQEQHNLLERFKDVLGNLQ